MPTEEAVLRAALRDELSRPLAGVRAELASTRRELESLSRTSTLSRGPLGSLGGSFGSLSKQVQSADSALRSSSSTLRGWAGDATKATTYGVGALTAAAGVFGVKASASFEQSRIAFGALLGDVDRGNRLFSELQGYNLSTPFDLPQVASATQTLLQFGFAGGQVMDVLKSIGDVASTGANPSESLERIAFAIGQIRTAGVLRAQDLNQLVQAGFPAYELVGQLSGLKGQGLRDAMQTGDLNVTADQFIGALTSMQGPLAGRQGAAAKQNKTLFGQFSNFGDTLRMQLSTAMQPLATELEKELGPFSDQVGKLLATIGPDINNLLMMLLHGVEALLPVLTPVLDAMLHGVGEFLTALGPSLAGMAPLGGQLGAAIGELFRELAADAPDLGRALVNLAGVLPDLVRVLDDLLPLLDGFARIVGGMPVGVLDAVLVTLLGFSALSSVVRTVYGMAEAMYVLAGAQTVLGRSGGLGAAGGLGGTAGKLGKGLGVAGGVVAGGGLLAGGLSSGSGWGGDLSTIGGAGILGATIGSVVPGVGTLVGGGIGLGVGGAVAGGRHLLGLTGPGVSHPQVAARTAAAGQVVNTTNIAIPEGAIVVNNPTSDVDVERAMRAYFTERTERG